MSTEKRFEDLDLMGVVERVLTGEELERPEGHAILNCPDGRLAVGLSLSP